MDSQKRGPHCLGNEGNGNSNKRPRDQNDDISLNEPLRTHFKPDPDAPPAPAPAPPVPNVKQEESAPGTSASARGSVQVKMEDTGNSPIPLTNFFEFASKPLPKIEPMVPTDIGTPLPRIPQQAHYNLHNEAEERSYVNIARERLVPIPAHQVDSDDEESESTVGVPLAHRYFRKELVLTKYKFDFYRFPDMKNLAAYRYKDQILETVKNHRITVIEGFTGCGKTTQVPQFILDKCVESGRTCNIVVTQPRRIAALSVARRVCQERGWEVGSVVGYQVGMETKVNPRETMITYMTTGVLLQKLVRSRSLKQYSHIIVDEVHERDLETDFLLLVMRKILMDDVDGNETHVKVILMSATLNATKFSKYFVTTNSAIGDTTEAPVIRIPASQARFPVEELFIDNLVQDPAQLEEISGNISEDKATILPEVYDLAVQTIVQFDDDERFSAVATNDPRRGSAAARDVKVETRGSVLVFLPGLQEIDTLFKLLNEENQKHMTANGGDPDYYKWNVVPLHSSITNEEQSKVFEPPGNGRRKIILATNIAESSVTVSDVVYVIDFCMTKSLQVDQRTNYSCLRLTWAAISQCTQRKGRTGRVAPGKVYRLVPKKFYLELRKEAEPEMLKSGLETIVLRVKTLNMGSPQDILGLAIDAPHVSLIERAVVNLKEAGALTIAVTKDGQKVYDTCDGDLTFLGKIMSALPISHQCARLIMLGHVFGVLKECIIIAAGLSVKSPFSNPFQKHLDSYLSKLGWAKKSHSDCFAILHVFKEWTNRFGEIGGGNRNWRGERMWGKGAFVQVSVLKEIRSVVEELHERLRNHGIVPCDLSFESPEDGSLSKEQSVMLKVAIAGAFYPNYFHRNRPDLKTYERERSREVNGAELLSTVYYKGFPPSNMGELYAQHIADRLTSGLDVPSIGFEGQKVLVTFDSKGEKIGPINKGVYRAVKIRQIREKMEFNVLWKDHEPNYLRANRPQNAHLVPCPELIALPGVGDSHIYVIVTYTENPSQFFVVYKQHEQILHSMNVAINKSLANIPLPRNQVTPGAFCLAPYTDETGERTYYRGKIRALNYVNKDALVYFVDFGNSDWVRIDSLQPFSSVHKQMGIVGRQTLAVECRLSEIKPAIMYGSVWHEEAIKNFKEFVAGAPLLRINVYCVVKSVIVGTLIGEDVSDGSKLNVNDKLFTEKYADRVPESYPCQLNHSARGRFELMKDDPIQIEAHNREQIAEVKDVTFILPPSDEVAKVRVELKGPWSPLELDFISLCHSSTSKQVVIDHQSVNSVSLDQEPSAPTSRLVVASSVVIQDKSGRVCARETTMMPAIPGLLALMAMVFSPKMELRVDKHQSKYTGVLCGLGVNPENKAVYQDHDVEIIFDTEISDDDIHTINKIRYFMNLILRDQNGANLGPTHKSVVEEMFNLLKVPRKRMEEEIWPQESYVWNRIDEVFIVPDKIYGKNLQPTDVFVPHSTVVLHKDARPNVSWNFAF